MAGLCQATRFKWDGRCWLLLLILHEGHSSFLLLGVPFAVKKKRPKLDPGLPESRWYDGLPRKITSYGFLAFTAVLALLPLWQILVPALEPTPPESASVWRFPTDATLDNFYRLMTGTEFLRWLANSLIIALAVTVIGVILSATSGYTLSRYRFFGRPTVLHTLLVTQLFPVTMVLLPIFLILLQLKLINTFFGVILIYLASILPFSIWQMKVFYDGIPETIEEAASLDGCTPAEIFRGVVLPISAPGLAVTALFSFTAAWNEYVIAAILLQNSERFTLPLGLRLLYSDTMAGVFAAGALAVTLPMLVFYVLLSRFLIARVSRIGIS